MQSEFPPIRFSLFLKLSLIIFLNLGVRHLAYLCDMWSPLPFLSSSHLLAFITSPLRLKFLRIPHALAHPPLRMMASFESFTYPLPPFDSPFLIMPTSSSSDEVVIAALSDFGEGNLPQRHNVHVIFWVDLPLHRCVLIEGFA